MISNNVSKLFEDEDDNYQNQQQVQSNIVYNPAPETADYDYSQSNFVSQFQQPSIHYEFSQMNTDRDISNMSNQNVRMNKSNITGISQISTSQQSKILFGKFDEEKFQKEAEQQARLERIKAVRQQESLASQSTVQHFHAKQQQDKEIESREQQYQEYLYKLQEIEKLKKQREVQLEQVGQAHEQAEAAEKARILLEIEKKEKQIKDQEMRRARGSQAYANERKLIEEKKYLEEEINRIERKKQVQARESNYAHSKANQYREQKEMDQRIDKQIKSLQDRQNQFNQNNSKASLPTGQEQYKNIDYTQTRFHTVQTTIANSETIQQSSVMSSFDQVNPSQNKAIKQKMQQLDVMVQNQERINQELEKQQKIAAIKAEQAAFKVTQDAERRRQQENFNRLNQEKVKDRAQKVLVSNNKQIIAGIEEKQYKDNKKKEGLQRIQDEIEAQHLRKKIMKDHRERMKNKREQVQIQQQEKAEALLADKFSFKIQIQEELVEESIAASFLKDVNNDLREIQSFDYAQEPIAQVQNQFQHQAMTAPNQIDFYSVPEEDINQIEDQPVTIFPQQPEYQQKPQQFREQFHQPQPVIHQIQQPQKFAPVTIDPPKDTLSMVNQFLNQNQDAMVNFDRIGKRNNLLDSDDEMENTQDLLQSRNVNHGLLDDESDNDLDLSQSEMNTVERSRPDNRDDIDIHQSSMPNFANLKSIEPVNDTTQITTNLADEFLGGITDEIDHLQQQNRQIQQRQLSQFNSGNNPFLSNAPNQQLNQMLEISPIQNEVDNTTPMNQLLQNPPPSYNPWAQQSSQNQMPPMRETFNNQPVEQEIRLPSHNAQILIEIDKPQSQENNLAAMSVFQKRMLERQQALEEKKRANAADKQPQKSKEELASLRKEMMKKSRISKTVVKEDLVKEPVQEHPKAALMSRLARGSKTEINKKDMLKLTNKNYENLPEVKRKKEEEKKKEELLKRLDQVKTLEKQRREKNKR